MRNNKSICALALSLALLVATDAFASRARLLALGTGDTGFLDGNGNGGSLYINDMYNIFYNPAYVSDYKDSAIIEKSNTTGTAAGAEGGFLAGMSGFTFGAYMNRVDGLSLVNNRNLTRPVELFLGGDTGVKWGIRFGFAEYTTRATVKTGASTWTNQTVSDKEMNATIGASFMNLDPFFSVKLNSDEGTPQNIAGGTGSLAALNGNSGTGKSHQEWKAGARYSYGEWTPYAVYKNAKNGVMNVDKGIGTWGVGFGRSMKGSESVSVNYGVSWWRVNQVRSVLPIEVSLEGKAASWLTLRGGVRYHLVDRNQQVSNIPATTAGVASGGQTTGRLGASFNFGRMDLDWAVGSAANTETLDGNTFDLSNGMFTAASLAYRW